MNDLPIEIIGPAGFLVLLLLFRMMSGKKYGPGKKKKHSIPGMDKLIKAGRYSEAGRLAFEHGRTTEAIDYFLRAQQPVHAAKAAAKGGQIRQAAELYEKAGKREHAIRCYRASGMTQKAEALEAISKKKSSAKTASPARSETPDVPASMDLKDIRDAAERQARGRELADRMLANGQIREAADAYREADLHDEAIHLYVNVLALPGEAAVIVSRQGNHERAAELYEMAGQLERAADSWISVAHRAGRPEMYLERIRQNSEEKVYAFLKDVTQARPLSPNTAELHYQLGLAYQAHQDSEEAVKVFVCIQESVGEYKDVDAKLQVWRTQAAAPKNNEVSQEDQRAREPSAPEAPAIDSGDLAQALAEDSPGADPFDAALPPELELPLDAEALEALALPRLADDGAPSLADDEFSAKEGALALEAPKTAEEVSPSIPQNPQIVLQPVVVQGGEFGLDLSEIAAMAMDAAEGISDRVERSNPQKSSDLLPAPKQLAQALSKREIRARAKISLNKEPVPPLLADAVVQAARRGPTVESLLQFVGEDGCTLQNIEAHYRVGLAHLGAGEWDQAASAFRKVEEVSPGYRDAAKRAEDIERWQGHLAPNLSELDVAGTQIPDRKKPSRYRLNGELGRGGMAVVYRAYDEVLGRDVALKFLSDQYAANPDVAEMFQREARSVAQLNHPNVVTIYDFGTLEGRTFIAMEHVEGVVLKDEIYAGTRLPVLESIRAIIQLLDALKYAHERSIIHRDIKPSNVMRSHTGILKLMDFGLAKSVEAGTDASMVAGTPAYMPPEQMAGQQVDARSDLFSTGVTLYEMLAGQRPFEGMDRNTVPRSLCEFNPAIPSTLDQLVLRSLELKPERRFQTAESFAAPLKRIVDAVGLAASTADIQSHDLPKMDVMPSLPILRGKPIPATSKHAPPEPIELDPSALVPIELDSDAYVSNVPSESEPADDERCPDTLILDGFAPGDGSVAPGPAATGPGVDALAETVIMTDFSERLKKS